MNNINQEEIDLVNIQLFATTLFSVIVLTSLALTYNRKLQLTNQKPFWTNEEAIAITNILGYASLIAVSINLYVAFKTTDILKRKGSSEEVLQAATLEDTAAVLAVIAALLIIQAHQLSDGAANINIENPEL